MTLSDKKDYKGVVLVGFCVPFFLIPIIKNILQNEERIPFLNQSLKHFLIDLNFPGWLLIAFLASLLFILSFLLVLFTAKKLATRLPVVLQIIKFIFVGGFNTLLDWSTVNLLIFFSGISTGLYFSLFKTISFLIANIASYFWNKNWTFQSNKKGASTFWQFFIVSLFGLLINVSIASIIVNFIQPIGKISTVLWAQLAMLVATAISMVWNFIGYKLIVFKK